MGRSGAARHPAAGRLPSAARLRPHHAARPASRSAATAPSTAIVEACAEPDPGRAETWINQPIDRLSRQLFALGYAHSVECWRDGELVGGLYGISLGGAFFGESMFSRERDASKVALVHLVLRLKLGGYRLLDTQFVTQHLQPSSAPSRSAGPSIAGG